MTKRADVAWLVGFLTGCVLFATIGLYRGYYGPSYEMPPKDLSCTGYPVMIK